MKLQIIFGVDKKTIEHQWKSEESYEDNMRKATIKAMEAGMTFEDFSTNEVHYKAIKEHDGECCPCCGSPLL